MSEALVLLAKNVNSLLHWEERGTNAPSTASPPARTVLTAVRNRLSIRRVAATVEARRGDVGNVGEVNLGKPLLNFRGRNGRDLVELGVVGGVEFEDCREECQETAQGKDEGDALEGRLGAPGTGGVAPAL
jgi:hypothetical protein